MFTCTGNTSISQENMDEGFLRGSVTVTASTPEGGQVIASDGSNNTLRGQSTITIRECSIYENTAGLTRAAHVLGSHALVSTATNG